MVWNRFLLVLSLTASVLVGSVCMMSADELTETETSSEVGVLSLESPHEVVLSDDIVEVKYDSNDVSPINFVCFSVNGEVLTYRYFVDNPDFYISLWSRNTSNRSGQFFLNGSGLGGSFSCSYWRTDAEKPDGKLLNYDYLSSIPQFSELSDEELDSPVVFRINQPTIIVFERSPLPSVFEVIMDAGSACLDFVLVGATSVLSWVSGEPLVLIGIAISLIGVCFIFAKKSSRGI